MHLRFAFDAAEQLRLRLQPMFNLVSGLRTLILINGISPASYRL